MLIISVIQPSFARVGGRFGQKCLSKPNPSAFAGLWWPTLAWLLTRRARCCTVPSLWSHFVWLHLLLGSQPFSHPLKPLSQITANRSGRKPKTIDPVITEKLFFSERGSASINQSLHHIFLKVKKQYPSIHSAKSIRNMVIAEWLKKIDVRKVQYMAGHRYVSSTERYNGMNLQELKDSLNKFHPMK